MKLFHLVMWRVSALLVAILTVWAVFFYWAIIEEVNDETDDSLGDYAETLIIRWLSGEEMPSKNSGSNNQYYLYEVSEIEEKKETEPARVLMTIFQTDDGRYMELVVYAPTIEKLDLQRALLGWIVFLYVLLLLAILAVNAWVFQRNMKPLYRLLDWLDRYRLGGKNKPLTNETSISEFRKLNDAAVVFTERSEKVYEQQKLFIGNASHEMQTPLAISLNRLEMLMEDDTLTEKQLSELAKTHQTLESLTRMNRSLLLLCKIENHQFSDEKEICLNKLFRTYLDDYQEVYAYRHIRVEVTEAATFRVTMSESLASVLVANLLKNAFVHADEGGEITVSFTAASFEISNTGEHPLDDKRIFERFYQGSKKEGSTGLGLALVDSVCKASHLSVTYRYADGRHVFTVSRS